MGRRNRCRVLAGVLGAIALAACGGEGGLVTDPLGGEPASVELAAPRDTLYRVGETMQLQAIVLNTQGHAQFGALVTWESSDSAVAKVGANGLVTAMGGGGVQIKARSGAAEGSIRLNVELGARLAAVNFADPKLATCVAQLGATYANEIERLNCANRGITSVAGIQALKRLAELTLGATSGDPKNQIRDLEPLAALSELRMLVLSWNGLSDIRPLAGLSKLQTLDLTINEVRDVSPLSGLTQLHNLYLYHNEIEDLRPLAALRGMRGTLVLSYNEIRDMSPLSALTQLTMLFIEGNQIQSMGAVAAMAALQTLDVSRNQITDTGPLAGHALMRDLRLGSNPLDAQDIVVLQSLPALRFLNLDELILTDRSPLSQLTGLTYLSLQKGGLTSVQEIAALTGLRSLYLGDNLLQDVSPISALTGLVYLSVPRNRIRTGVATLVGLTQALSIDLSHNPLMPCADVALLTQRLGSNVVTSLGGCAG